MNYEVLIHHPTATFCGGFRQGTHPWGTDEHPPIYGVYVVEDIQPMGEIDYPINIDTEAGRITIYRSQLGD